MPALWYPDVRLSSYHFSEKALIIQVWNTSYCMSINFAIVQFWIDTHHFASLVAQLHVRQLSLYKYKKNILGSISGQRTGYLMFADSVTKCLLLIVINKECYRSIFWSMAFFIMNTMAHSYATATIIICVVEWMDDIRLECWWWNFLAHTIHRCLTPESQDE